MGQNDICEDRDIITIPMGFWNMPDATEWTAATLPIVAERERAEKQIIAAAISAKKSLYLREEQLQREMDSIRTGWKEFREICPHPQLDHTFDGVESSVECVVCRTMGRELNKQKR